MSLLDEKAAGLDHDEGPTKDAKLQSSATEPDVEASQTRRPGYDPEAEANYRPKTLKFWLVVLSIFVPMFLVALDRTILATAIPRITDEFGSLGDIGWYGSAYLLTTAACQLLFGRIYKFYSTRWTFLIAIVIFEVGSALCGAAPSSPAFVAGRAIAGVGAAGIWTGSMMAIIPMVPLHKRPMFQGLFGMVFGVSSVVGPLMGGAFTERASWRWCFYLNLPVGAVAFSLLCLFMHPADAKVEPATMKQQIMRLDPLGTFFFVPCVVCLLLALQWGGSTYAWDSWRIILLLVMFGLAGIAFAMVQTKMPTSATLPLRLIKQRTMLAGTVNTLFLAGGMMLVVYYLPLWFQATKGVDAVKSGICTLLLVLSLVIASIVSGAGTQKIGYYTPFMIMCPCIAAIGEGLLTTLTPATGSSRWIAFQFLTGFGVGLGMQSVGLAVQATLPKEDVSTGVAITFFAQQLGGAIFVAVGQTILSSVLVNQLSGLPGFDAVPIVKTGATELRHVVPSHFLDRVMDAYNLAITRIFYCALALALAQLFSALFVEWRSIKKPREAEAAGTEAGQEALGD
ncbi:Major facilitator superfamily domain, general substrate transporter [Metarhizium album ARSEF 1941]|uniref:Major facilitator superfamily domain, general substrate transporter n=1 Tax=Metarhizium album (strain ARSEF 1941) TaxID=1081103 RepID=A0A0B2WJ33_METAS|nr:Major facilitator superfamily domain, general substrate transporter [Metarhizium album ARSEF 1941]KHN96056.1 Major facilitator superfamily domain, general substrate transporter [Metarhizium album ARSEF 1941]